MNTAIRSRLALRAERGVTLFVALIAVVALSLAAIALIRSIDTGTLVIGNLGFKQDTTRASDQAAEQAIAWIAANLGGTALQSDISAQGYYASSLDALDPTGTRSSSTTRALVDWNNDNCAWAAAGSFGGGCFGARAANAVTVAGADAYQVQTSYIITRLCPATGSDSGMNCAKPAPGAANEGSKRSGIDYSEYTRFTAGASPYYRIVVRTVGARNTVSYTETIVHF